MQNYFTHLNLFLKRWLLVMALFSFSRLLFYWFNASHFDLSTGQVILHFIYGIKFDLASFGLVNLLLVLLATLPDVLLDKKWYQTFFKFLFITVNSIMLGFEFIDIKFFEFEEKRLTADVFSAEWLSTDFKELLPHFIKDYWYLLLLYVVVVLFFYKRYPTYHKKVYPSIMAPWKKYSLQGLLSLLMVGIFLLFGRGGFGLKPLRVISAANYAEPENVSLVLNSTFTLLKTANYKALEQKTYFNQDELELNYSPIQHFSSNEAFKQKNVVVIIMESFGREYSGYLNNNTGYTPVLDSLMQLSLNFTQAYANGKTSMESVPTIISGLPSLMNKSVITSKYTTNKIQSLANMLGDMGYVTSFFHGGKNGTMGFDNYTKMVGVDHYYGVNEYNYDYGFDGAWGIYDEQFFDFTIETLTNYKKPFFSTVFSISSHHPYHIPERFAGKFPKGDLVNLESIGYADYALGTFMAKAAKQDWYDNTIFVITADHTAQTMGGFYNTIPGKYSIPLLIFDPSNDKLKGDTNIICQQADIFPSVLDYLNYDGAIVCFGNSVFNKDAKRFAVSYKNGMYQFIFKQHLFIFDGEQVVEIRKINDEDAKEPALTEVQRMEALNLLKGIIQQYNYRLEENQLFIPNQN